MTDELSVIELIMGASLTVKLVMATLLAASVFIRFQGRAQRGRHTLRSA